VEKQRRSFFPPFFPFRRMNNSIGIDGKLPGISCSRS
jgi:hypothetical protein